MATYPTDILQVQGTQVIGQSGKEVRRSTSGKPRIRSYYTDTRRTIRIRHYIDQTDLDTLLTFYDTNEDIPFTFVYQADDVSYSCYFASYPSAVPSGGGYYNVEVMAVEA